MDTVPLELPAELVKLARLDAANMFSEASTIIALDLFRERKVSIGRAAGPERMLWSTTCQGQ